MDTESIVFNNSQAKILTEKFCSLKCSILLLFFYLLEK